MSTIRKTFKIAGIPTNMTSVILSDSTSTYGVKRNDTSAVIVPDNTSMTNVSPGVYEYVFTDPAFGLSYTYSLEVTYNGETFWVENTFDGPATIPSSGTTTFTNYTYVPKNQYTSARLNHIVDDLLTPRLLAFRQVYIHDEKGTLLNDGHTWQFTYRNWNTAYNTLVHLGNSPSTPASYTIDHANGTIVFLAATTKQDVVNATYNFDYFGSIVIQGFVSQAIDIINTMAFGPAQAYDLDSAPAAWDGVIAEWAYIFAIERLIMDYDLWYGRLIFAINGIDDGGDILGVLQSLKADSEARVNKIMDNPWFKIPPSISAPTSTYYQAIRGIGRSSYTRGWRPNRYV